MSFTAPEAYWTRPPDELLAALASRRGGLSPAEAAARLKTAGANRLAGEDRVRALRLLGRQFESPLVLILIFGAALSMALGQWTDASIIVVIVFASALLGFRQEYVASSALQKLKQRISLLATVRRGGAARDLPASGLVPGDIVELTAGDLIPADGVLLDAKDFLVTESVLTGESMPVEKTPGVSPATAPLNQRNNCAFAGTHVRSGMATLLVVATGRATQVGDIARMLEAAEPETEFERGVRRFGYLLIRVMIVMVLFVLTVSQLLGRPLIESLLFAVALAVGMTPELLPAIVSVTLSAGARNMAAHGVIVRKLEALENLGSMDILCTDKTGTLTEGSLTLTAAADALGAASAAVRRLAFLNSAHETGIDNPIDEAVLKACADLQSELAATEKIDEIPYDFARKRLTIVVSEKTRPRTHLMITKGSFENVLAVCSSAAVNGRAQRIDDALKQKLRRFLDERGAEGFRVLAVARRTMAAKPRYAMADERDMEFCGFLLFADPPKKGAAQALAALAALGIRTKIITGDNRNVAVHVAASIGLPSATALTGGDIAAMKDEALWAMAEKADLFVEVDPQQKERIIRAIQKRGHAVGYLGDGINDAPALRAADVGISVDQAVDVARQTADVVLLRRDLDVLRLGVESGRRTFANTLKYISITISANFGNMLSMALATPFLPFLPLLAKQILLNNFLSDLPSLAITTDNVDAAQAARAERWNVAEVQHFMVVFGLLSSVFDLLTFLVLLKVLASSEQGFRTAWFVVSLLTQVLVVLLLRTRAPAWRSRPSTALLAATLLVAVLALAIPYIQPVARLFGFQPIPPLLMALLLAIAATYLAATELAKRWFYRSA